MQPLYEYVCHIKGHRNSKGELAEWVIKSHETGEILSSHKSEQKAKEHLQQMHIFQEAAEASERKKEIPVIVCADMGMGKTTFVQKINDSGKYKCYDLEVCDLPNIWGEPDEDGNMALVDGWEDIALKKIKSLDADVVAITSDPKMVNKLIESGIPFFLAYKDDISAIRKDIEKRTSEHFANVVKDFWKYIEKSDIPEELKEQMKECDPKAMTNIKCADALPPSIIETDKFQSDDRYRHWHDMFKLKTGGKAVSIMDRNIENLESRLKEFGKITSNLCTKLRLNAGEYLSSPSILHKILDRVEEKGKKSDKLLGESTYGTDMDKRIKIFMEGVSQLGLSKNQVDAIGKLTNACMESVLDDFTDEGLADSELLVYTPENDAEFFKEAFKRAAIKVQDKFPDRLYEDEVPEKGLVLVDKKSGNRFSLVLRKGPADPIHFDPNCHGIEVRIGSDRKEYPLWLRKSKSIDELIDLMFDCIAQEVRYASDDEELPYNHTGRGKKVHMEGVVGNGDISRDDEAYGLLLQRLHEIDVPDETIEIATHILGDSKETLIKIGNAVATMINNGDRSFRDNFCFNYDHKTGKVKFCMEGVGRRPVFYMEDRATATNPDPNYRIMYRELVEKGFSRDTLSILTIILGATVDTLKKIVHAKHELEERDNMRIPAEAFRDWNGKHDNSDDNEELGSMDFGGDVGPDSAFWDLPIGGLDDFGGDGDLGEIGKISER